VNSAAKPEAKLEKSPWHREIPDAKQVFVGELAQHGEWIVANIQTGSVWPVSAQKVMWRGLAFWIIPVMKDHYPAVAMRVPAGRSRSECEGFLMRFVSNLSWVENRGFMVDGVGGGNLPRPMGRDKKSGFSICDEFDLSYFPEPASREALLALALMREGRGLNHPAYAFLSFFRVLEVAFPDGKERKKWVEANAGAVTGHRVKEAIDELKKKGITDIGTHLFESGRCAVAHASREPIVDPDNPDDYRRLFSEIPIVLALAQKAIEEKLGVETSQTVYRKHLYELAGFKEILGPDLVEHLTRGEQVTDGRMVEIPDISIRIRKRDPYTPLTNLSVKDMGQDGNLFHMRFGSKDGSVMVRFVLDFSAERLEFSPFDGARIKDTGGASGADDVAEVCRFQNDLFGNGQLQIVDGDTGNLIARKDAYIPINMYLDQEAADATVAKWKQLAEQRRERDKRYGNEIKRLSMSYDVRFAPSTK
jgi:hypothetical protein